eukprot:6425834-Amphidinium_carterae.1
MYKTGLEPRQGGVKAAGYWHTEPPGQGDRCRCDAGGAERQPGYGDRNSQPSTSKPSTDSCSLGSFAERGSTGDPWNGPRDAIVTTLRCNKQVTGNGQGESLPPLDTIVGINMRGATVPHRVKAWGSPT